MSPPTTIKLPQLSLPHQRPSFKGRKRSGSIVRVEEVGERLEELLDRSAYVNINANWVDSKGACARVDQMLLANHTPRRRRMVNSRRPRLHRQDHHRHYPRHNAASQLDPRQLDIPCGKCPHLFLAPRLDAQQQQLSYLMFHGVTGIPFDNDLHAGAYDDLTLWEQIDDGAQYTPSKKWLFSMPIILWVSAVSGFVSRIF